MKISKNLLLLFLCLSCCKGQNVYDCNSFEKILFSMSLQEVLLLNKQIIPCLIDSIDTQETSVVGYKNPISSYIANYHFNQIGIKYAYNIDYILSKDSIETVMQTLSDNEDHWEEKTKSYRIYNIGVIVKKGKNNQLILEPLTHEDMINIKKMYFDWWEKNKNKSIETLREEFRKGNKILQLPYVWI